MTEDSAAIERYLEQHNADPEPFVWTAEAADILKKVARAKQALESQQDQTSDRRRNLRPRHGERLPVES